MASDPATNPRPSLLRLVTALSAGFAHRIDVLTHEVAQREVVAARETGLATLEAELAGLDIEI